MSSPTSRPSKFDRIIALDWHDGLRAGLAACVASQQAYSVEFRSWDDQQARRIYALYPISSSTFERLLGLLSSLGPPKWPIWFPVWRFASQHEQEAAERALERLRSEAYEPTCVVLAKDLSREIIRSATLRDVNARKRFAMLDARSAPFSDWNALLKEVGGPGGSALCE